MMQTIKLRLALSGAVVASFLLTVAPVGLSASLAQGEPPAPEVTQLSLSEGGGIVAGEVSTDYNLFQFEGQQGQTVILDVDVTTILMGSVYTDEDSQLYLIGDQGRILAFNDDEDENNFESRLRFVLPENGTYYVAVTTFGNQPVVNDEQQITSWQNTGLGHIRYDLIFQVDTPAEVR